MNDETMPTCVCPMPADALRAAMEGKPVPRCEMHSFGYEPPEPHAPDSVALNSDALTQTILRRLGADAENTFTSLNQPNL